MLPGKRFSAGLRAEGGMPGGLLSGLFRVVHDYAQEGRWEKSIELEPLWGDDFHDKSAFKQDGFSFPRGEVGERGIACVAIEKLLQRVPEERVVRGEKLQIFAGESCEPVEGGRESLFRYVCESFGLTLATLENKGPL